jgi:hypothetical protein
MTDAKDDDAKAKFREVLERKREVSRGENGVKTPKSKISGAQSSGPSQRIFRRKSGSA